MQALGSFPSLALSPAHVERRCDGCTARRTGGQEGRQARLALCCHFLRDLPKPSLCAQGLSGLACVCWWRGNSLEGFPEASKEPPAGRTLKALSPHSDQKWPVIPPFIRTA